MPKILRVRAMAAEEQKPLEQVSCARQVERARGREFLNSGQTWGRREYGAQSLEIVRDL
jgi:hypothetical protein